MDKTAVFKAYVKTIKTRNRAFGSLAVSGTPPPPPPPSSVDNGPRQRKPAPASQQQQRRDEFSRRAKDVVNDVAKLADFLNRHYRHYIDVQSFDQHTTLTDADRDKIDVGAQHIVKTCGQQVKALRAAAGADGGQLADHRRQIVRYVEWRLKAVARLFDEIRATRASRRAEYENHSRLSHLARDAARRRPELVEREPAAAAAAANANDDDDDRLRYDALTVDELSPEELQMFEAENVEMYNELNQLSSEVRNIESKAVRIAELQQLFTEKILEQDHDLERIDTIAANTTENIVDANTEIRSAIQTNAGLRVYILFFILVLSFTLLFLDWYND